jgi:outer membrane lipoprotein carrier protein
MLWRYNEPKGQLILADGTYLYFYQPEERQVLKSTLSKSFLSDIPLSFLLGIGDLRRDFRVHLEGSEPDHYVLQLVPKQELRGVNEFHLGIKRDEFDILWFRIEDAVENITTVRFSEMQIGMSLKDSLFHLQVPEEVDIVEVGP